jgi:hypothetical protein
MPSSYSTKFRLELPADGEKINQWGGITNNNLGLLLEQAIDGYADVALTDANTTLTASNAIADQARNKIIRFTGTLTATREVVIPATGRVYVMWNATNQSLTYKTSLGNGVTCPAGSRTLILCDAFDTFELLTFSRLAGGSISGMSQIAATDVLRGGVNLADFSANTINGNYTIVDTDRHRTILRTGASACALTIPANASLAFPIGTIVKVVCATGASAMTVTGAGGVTLRRVGTGVGTVTLNATSTVELLKVATDEWYLTGAVV